MNEIPKKLGLLSLHSIWLFLIFFGIPLIRGITGVGVYIGSFPVGLMPEILLYLYWLFLLTTAVGPSRMRHTIVVRRRLVVAMFIAYPIYWYLLYRIVNDELPYVLLPISLLVFMPIFFAIFSAFLFISRAMYGITQGVPIETTTFKKTAKLFFLFLGGPFTIWMLQPKIRAALVELRNSQLKVDKATERFNQRYRNID